MQDEYLIKCWYCTMEYDLTSAEWCKCNADHPTKVCPYCLKCFCGASDEYKKEIWSNAPEEIKKERSSFLMPKDKLGDLLIAKGLLSSTQLLEALKTQKETKRKLGEVLVDLKYITEQEIISALSDQYDLVQIELDMRKMPDPDIFKYLSMDFCEKNNVAPIDLQDIGNRSILYIAITSPPDKEIIARIGEITGFQVYPYLASKASIVQFLSGIKRIVEVKPKSMNLSISIEQLVEELIKKSLTQDCNNLHLIKNKNNECFVEMRYFSNIISNMQIKSSIHKQLREHLLSETGIETDNARAESIGLLDVKVSGSRLLYVLTIAEQDKIEKIILERITKNHFMNSIRDLKITEKSLINLKSNLLKPAGFSAIIGKSRIETLATIYSLHCYLIEKGSSVFSLQEILPFEMEDIGYLNIRDASSIEDIDILDDLINSDYLTIDKNPFLFFTDRKYFDELLEEKHIIANFRMEKILDLFQYLYENELLNEFLIEKLNFIICLKPIKKICDECREPMNLNPRLLKSLGLTDEEIPNITPYKGRGCEKCGSTGFFGEILLHKIIDFPKEWKEELLSQPVLDFDLLKRSIPPANIRQIGLDYVNMGIITLSELLKNI